MLTEGELKNELAERLLKKFFADAGSFEDNLTDAKLGEDLIKKLTSELIGNVSAEFKPKRNRLKSCATKIQFLRHPIKLKF